MANVVFCGTNLIVNILWHESIVVFCGTILIVYILWHESDWQPASQQPASKPASQQASKPTSQPPALHLLKPGITPPKFLKSLGTVKLTMLSWWPSALHDGFRIGTTIGFLSASACWKIQILTSISAACGLFHRRGTLTSSPDTYMIVEGCINQGLLKIVPTNTQLA